MLGGWPALPVRQRAERDQHPRRHALGHQHRPGGAGGPGHAVPPRRSERAKAAGRVGFVSLQPKLRRRDPERDAADLTHEAGRARR